MTLDYELAKELKDAGFPQIFMDGRPALVNAENTEYAYNPTLEELIEACGDKFHSLERDLDPDEIWYAFEVRDDLEEQSGIGKTPIEAVARLWLALNKKV